MNGLALEEDLRVVSKWVRQFVHRVVVAYHGGGSWECKGGNARAENDLQG